MRWTLAALASRPVRAAVLGRQGFFSFRGLPSPLFFFLFFFFPLASRHTSTSSTRVTLLLLAFSRSHSLLVTRYSLSLPFSPRLPGRPMWGTGTAARAKSQWARVSFFFSPARILHRAGALSL